MLEIPPYSFKDPAAVVIKKKGAFHRFIHAEYLPEYQHLMESGLYQALLNLQLIIPHEENPKPNLPAGYVKELIPIQLDYQILPFEWSFQTWKKCIISYLEINQIALQYGMILKDASPYNFSVQQGNALLFDTSSFIFFKENTPWLSYRQFCEEFLAPFTLMKYNGSTWARLYRSHLKGLPLEFVSKQLPLTSFLNLTVLIHLHWHSKYSPHAHESDRKANLKKGFSTQSLNSLYSWLKKSLNQWNKPYPYKTHWSSYYQQSIESPIYLQHKKRVIENWIKKIKPRSLTDLGANTGEFSIIASSHVEKVLAIESASNCIDDLDNTCAEKSIRNIYTAVADLTQLSPDLGNNFQEFSNLGKRGSSEMVMALALVHHLCISNHFSASQVISLMKIFCQKYLIIEFVPLEDHKAHTLQDQIGISNPNYTIITFRNSLQATFEIKEEISLDDSYRTLFLAERK